MIATVNIERKTRQSRLVFGTCNFDSSNFKFVNGFSPINESHELQTALQSTVKPSPRAVF